MVDRHHATGTITTFAGDWRKWDPRKHLHDPFSGQFINMPDWYIPPARGWSGNTVMAVGAHHWKQEKPWGQLNPGQFTQRTLGAGASLQDRDTYTGYMAIPSPERAVDLLGYDTERGLDKPRAPFSLPGSWLYNPTSTDPTPATFVPFRTTMEPARMIINPSFFELGDDDAKERALWRALSATVFYDVPPGVLPEGLTGAEKREIFDDAYVAMAMGEDDVIEEALPGLLSHIRRDAAFKRLPIDDDGYIAEPADGSVAVFGDEPNYPIANEVLVNGVLRPYYSQEHIERVFRDVTLGKYSVADGFELGMSEARDGDTWGPLPPELWHVSIDAPEVMRDGKLLSRDELGVSESGAVGLAGGSSITVSTTSDEKVAQDIYSAMLEAHRFMTNEITVEDLLQDDHDDVWGIGSRATLTQMMHELGHYPDPDVMDEILGHDVPVARAFAEVDKSRLGQEAIAEARRFMTNEITISDLLAADDDDAWGVGSRAVLKQISLEGGFPMVDDAEADLIVAGKPQSFGYGAILDELREFDPDDEDLMDARWEWFQTFVYGREAVGGPPSPIFVGAYDSVLAPDADPATVLSMDVQPDATGIADVIDQVREYPSLERDGLTEHYTGMSARWDFYRSFIAAREAAGGPLDPVFVGGFEGILKTNPDLIGVIKLKPKPGAMGYRTFELAEFRTSSGALDVVESYKPEIGDEEVPPITGWKSFALGSYDAMGVAELARDPEQFLRDNYERLTEGPPRAAPSIEDVAARVAAFDFSSDPMVIADQVATEEFDRASAQDWARIPSVDYLRTVPGEVGEVDEAAPFEVLMSVQGRFARERLASEPDVNDLHFELAEVDQPPDELVSVEFRVRDTRTGETEWQSVDLLSMALGEQPLVDQPVQRPLPGGWSLPPSAAAGAQQRGIRWRNIVGNDPSRPIRLPTPLTQLRMSRNPYMDEAEVERIIDVNDLFDQGAVMTLLGAEDPPNLVHEIAHKMTREDLVAAMGFLEDPQRIGGALETMGWRRRGGTPTPDPQFAGVDARVLTAFTWRAMSELDMAPDGQGGHQPQISLGGVNYSPPLSVMQGVRQGGRGEEIVHFAQLMSPTLAQLTAGASLQDSLADPSDWVMSGILARAYDLSAHDPYEAPPVLTDHLLTRTGLSVGAKRLGPQTLEDAEEFFNHAFGEDDPLAARLTDTYEDLLGTFPEMGFTGFVITEDTPGTESVEFAVTTSGELGINVEAFRRLDAEADHLEVLRAAGVDVPRSDIIGDRPEDVLIHEFGHAVVAGMAKRAWVSDIDGMVRSSRAMEEADKAVYDVMPDNFKRALNDVAAQQGITPTPELLGHMAARVLLEEISVYAGENNSEGYAELFTAYSMVVMGRGEPDVIGGALGVEGAKAAMMVWGDTFVRSYVAPIDQAQRAVGPSPTWLTLNAEKNATPLPEIYVTTSVPEDRTTELARLHVDSDLRRAGDHIADERPGGMEIEHDENGDLLAYNAYGDPIDYEDFSGDLEVVQRGLMSHLPRHDEVGYDDDGRDQDLTYTAYEPDPEDPENSRVVVLQGTIPASSEPVLEVDPDYRENFDPRFFSEERIDSLSDFGVVTRGRPVVTTVITTTANAPMDPFTEEPGTLPLTVRRAQRSLVEILSEAPARVSPQDIVQSLERSKGGLDQPEFTETINEAIIAVNAGWREGVLPEMPSPLGIEHRLTWAEAMDRWPEVVDALNLIDSEKLHFRAVWRTDRGPKVAAAVSVLERDAAEQAAAEAAEFDRLQTLYGRSKSLREMRADKLEKMYGAAFRTQVQEMAADVGDDVLSQIKSRFEQENDEEEQDFETWVTDNYQEMIKRHWQTNFRYVIPPNPERLAQLRADGKQVSTKLERLLTEGDTITATATVGIGHVYSYGGDENEPQIEIVQAFMSELTGTRIGGSSRTITPSEHEGKHVYHNSQSFDADYQGSGIGTYNNRRNDAWYVANGMNLVEVSTATEGGYHWAGDFFDWQDEDKTRRDLRAIANNAKTALQDAKAAFERGEREGASPEKMEALQIARIAAYQAVADADELLSRDISDVTPWEVAHIGWTPANQIRGATGRSWVGRDFYHTSGWHGYKNLSDLADVEDLIPDDEWTGPVSSSLDDLDSVWRDVSDAHRNGFIATSPMEWGRFLDDNGMSDEKVVPGTFLLPSGARLTYGRIPEVHVDEETDIDATAHALSRISTLYEMGAIDGLVIHAHGPRGDTEGRVAGSIGDALWLSYVNTRNARNADGRPRWAIREPLDLPHLADPTTPNQQIRAGGLINMPATTQRWVAATAQERGGLSTIPLDHLLGDHHMGQYLDRPYAFDRDATESTGNLTWTLDGEVAFQVDAADRGFSDLTFVSPDVSERDRSIIFATLSSRVRLGSDLLYTTDPAVRFYVDNPGWATLPNGLTVSEASPRLPQNRGAFSPGQAAALQGAVHAFPNDPPLLTGNAARAAMPQFLAGSGRSALNVRPSASSADVISVTVNDPDTFGYYVNSPERDPDGMVLDEVAHTLNALSGVLDQFNDSHEARVYETTWKGVSIELPADTNAVTAHRLREMLAEGSRTGYPIQVRSVTIGDRDADQREPYVLTVDLGATTEQRGVATPSMRLTDIAEAALDWNKGQGRSWQASAALAPGAVGEMSRFNEAERHALLANWQDRPPMSRFTTAVREGTEPSVLTDITASADGTTSAWAGLAVMTRRGLVTEVLGTDENAIVLGDNDAIDRAVEFLSQGDGWTALQVDHDAWPAPSENAEENARRADDRLAIARSVQEVAEQRGLALIDEYTIALGEPQEGDEPGVVRTVATPTPTPDVVTPPAETGPLVVPSAPRRAQASVGERARAYDDWYAEARPAGMWRASAGESAYAPISRFTGNDLSPIGARHLRNSEMDAMEALGGDPAADQQETMRMTRGRRWMEAPPMSGQGMTPVSVAATASTDAEAIDSMIKFMLASNQVLPPDQQWKFLVISNAATMTTDYAGYNAANPPGRFGPLTPLDEIAVSVARANGVRWDGGPTGVAIDVRTVRPVVTGDQVAALSADMVLQRGISNWQQGESRALTTAAADILDDVGESTTDWVTTDPTSAVGSSLDLRRQARALMIGGDRVAPGVGGRPYYHATTVQRNHSVNDTFTIPLMATSQERSSAVATLRDPVRTVYEFPSGVWGLPLDPEWGDFATTLATGTYYVSAIERDDDNNVDVVRLTPLSASTGVISTAIHDLDLSTTTTTPESVPVVTPRPSMDESVEAWFGPSGSVPELEAAAAEVITRAGGHESFLPGVRTERPPGRATTPPWDLTQQHAQVLVSGAQRFEERRYRSMPLTTALNPGDTVTIPLLATTDTAPRDPDRESTVYEFPNGGYGVGYETEHGISTVIVSGAYAVTDVQDDGRRVLLHPLSARTAEMQVAVSALDVPPSRVFDIPFARPTDRGSRRNEAMHEWYIEGGEAVEDFPATWMDGNTERPPISRFTDYNLDDTLPVTVVRPPEIDAMIRLGGADAAR